MRSLVGIVLACSSSAAVDRSTLDNKLMVGYQAWHATPADGAGLNWEHWSNDGHDIPGPATVHVDAFPSLTEYPPSVLQAVNFSWVNGSAVSLYSAQDAATTNVHWGWMRDYGIDGAFVQRFLSDTMGEPTLAARDRVFSQCRSAAEATGLAFAVEYDVSGVADVDLLKAISKDWAHVTAAEADGGLGLTESPAYLHHRGRPAVIVWGLGFNDDGHPATPTTAAAIQALFAAANVTLIGGVPTGWRTLSGDARPEPAWTTVYLGFSVIHPWLVGRFPDDAGADAEYSGTMIPDMAVCAAHGIDYLPCVWPGFSWTNMHGGSTPLNQIPRQSGSFLWNQLNNLLHNGSATMLFGAMFDEVDEATAMYKIAATEEDIPAGGRFIYAGVDGDRVRSDWWLYILSVAASVLNGTTPWPGAQRPALPTAQTELAATLAYAGLLGRAPRALEEVSAASTIAGGGSGEGALEAVCQVLVDTGEFVHDALPPVALATQLYEGILGRPPDPAGLNATLEAIAANHTAARAADMIECQVTRPPC